jgi:hypothetical protein
MNTAKTCFLALLLTGVSFVATAQQNKTYDIFSYKTPAGFVQKDSKNRLFFEKVEGSTYCQLYLWPAITGQSDVEKDFQANWETFAHKASQIPQPETKEKSSAEGWDVIFGAARGQYNNSPYVMSISTFTQKDMSYAIVAVLNDQKYLPQVQDFIGTVKPDTKKFVRNQVSPPTPANTGNAGITKTTTNFNDGWIATPTADYVRVSKASTEIRLHFINAQFDDQRPNTTNPEAYYWAKWVSPEFTVANPQKWSGVEYPVIYFMQGEAIEKKTGKKCFVAMKVIYEGGAQVVMAITPTQTVYQQQFAHPNDLNRMTGYNKFAITAADVVGKWSKAGGGGVEYYNAYTGNYAGMSALSTTDEFTFQANGNYESIHNSAATNNGGTKFAALTYKGKFTASDWELMAGNRVSGKTKKFLAQFIAVKGGFLLQLTDSDYTPLVYTLFKTK